MRTLLILLAMSAPLTSISPPAPRNPSSNLVLDGKSPPSKYGAVVFPNFQALDIHGPLDVLNMLSLRTTLTLSILAATLDPVSTRPTGTNPANSTFGQAVVPTHTFDTAPDDIEVLLVPGGGGVRQPELVAPVAEYVSRVYPKLRYLVTVCTGSALVAQTGLLDGRRATTNKRSWTWATSQGPRVDWVPKARWVADGNILTSSGVAAGIDATFYFVERLYGAQAATDIEHTLEFRRVTDPDDDPFAEYWNVTKPPVEAMVPPEKA